MFGARLADGSITSTEEVLDGVADTKSMPICRLTIWYRRWVDFWTFRRKEERFVIAIFTHKLHSTTSHVNRKVGLQENFVPQEILSRARKPRIKKSLVLRFDF